MRKKPSPTANRRLLGTQPTFTHVPPIVAVNHKGTRAVPVGSNRRTERCRSAAEDHQIVSLSHRLISISELYITQVYQESDSSSSALSASLTPDRSTKNC